MKSMQYVDSNQIRIEGTFSEQVSVTKRNRGSELCKHDSAALENTQSKQTVDSAEPLITEY